MPLFYQFPCSRQYGPDGSAVPGPTLRSMDLQQLSEHLHDSVFLIGRGLKRGHGTDFRTAFATA